MLVIAVLVLATLVFVRHFVSRDERSRLSYGLALILFWCIGWLAVVQLEAMDERGSGTYGSDAAYYFDRMVNASREEAPFRTAMEGPSGGYVAFGTLILLTSPFESVVWVKLANILALILALSFLYWLLRERGVRPKVARLIVLLMGFNGTITWMVLRNLKDTLFVSTCLLEIVVLYLLFHPGKPVARRNIALAMLLALVFGYVISTIRSWGTFLSGFILFSTLLGAFFEGYVRRTNFLLTLVLGGILSFLYLGWFSTGLKTYQVFRKYNQEPSELVTALPSATQIPLLALRFLTGPGIVRPLYSEQAFRVTTRTGNALIFLGSLMWWGLLPILFLTLTRPMSRIVRSCAVTGPALLFLCVYAYVYGGTADTRTRAVFYLLSAPLIGSYIEETFRCSTSACRARVLTYSALLAALMCSGIIISYKSLGW
jgi:hypothetical protein